MTKRARHSFLRHHSLSIASMCILLSWILLYSHSDPSTHMGAFFGNAIADWTGVMVMVLATKFMYEKGSAESRQPSHPLLRPVWKGFQEHSLTIFLLLTGVVWVWLFATCDPDSKWGQVFGNIVSEWTQIFGLVILTKRLVETHSKESHR